MYSQYHPMLCVFIFIRCAIEQFQLKEHHGDTKVFCGLLLLFRTLINIAWIDVRTTGDDAMKGHNRTLHNEQGSHLASCRAVFLFVEE